MPATLARSPTDALFVALHQAHALGRASALREALARVKAEPGRAVEVLTEMESDNRDNAPARWEISK